MLTDAINEAVETHLAGLIGGDRLKDSEVRHWIELLTEASNAKFPAAQARLYGFTFIRKHSDIQPAIKHLRRLIGIVSDAEESDYACPATDNGHRFIVVDTNPGLRFRCICQRCGYTISRALSN